MSMHNGGGASNSQGLNGSSGTAGPVSIIITGSRLNEQHQLLNP